MNDAFGVNLELHIDDTKISIRRGPASCKGIAIQGLELMLVGFSQMPKETQAAAQHQIDDLEQALAWLRGLEV